MLKLRTIAAMRVAGAFLAFASMAANAYAQSLPPDAPGAVANGSADTQVGGKPAAREGDGDAGGPIVEGSPDVLINGKPAASAGAKIKCGAHVANGAQSVFVNGKAMASAGDPTTACRE